MAGLISQAGYWTGDRTFKKKDYDTFENQELIDLNVKLFDEAGYDGNYEMEYADEPIQRIAALADRIGLEPYRAFVNKCNANRPWVWKDPRLWLTIRFWIRLLEPSDLRFIVLTRELMQMWVSVTIRRQIQSYHYLQLYTERVRTSILRFVEEHGLLHHEMCYEDLIVNTEPTIERLNEFLGLELSRADLEAIYSGDLGKRSRGLVDSVKALAIYLKNYRSRYR